MKKLNKLTSNKSHTNQKIKVARKNSVFYYFNIIIDGNEVARASLFLIRNKLHDQPYGLLEDVYVDEKFRGSGFGTKIVKNVINKAQKCQCYKLIATSRTSRQRVHELYQELGFTKHGIEFRIDF